MPPTGRRVPDLARIAPAGIVAGIALCYAGARAIHEPVWPTDFDQLWHSARALLRGVDPYSVVGPRERPFYWLWPLYYPLPAVLAAIPLSWLPVAVARVTFATLSAGVLGWSMGRRLVHLWPMLLSAAFLIAVARTQWSPLLLAAAWTPGIAWVATAKPNVGLASLAVHVRGRSLMTALVGVVGAIVLSFLVRPDWYTSWREAIAGSPHISAPITRPLGFLILLAVLKWRRPEARLLLVLGCVPHTASLYDLLPLFFACRSLRESLSLALLTQLLFWGFIMYGSGNTFEAYAENLGRAALIVVYLPVLMALLWRPNVSPAPSSQAGPVSWREAIPARPVDVLLSIAVLVAAFFLAWLPLNTQR